MTPCNIIIVYASSNKFSRKFVLQLKKSNKYLFFIMCPILFKMVFLITCQTLLILKKTDTLRQTIFLYVQAY